MARITRNSDGGFVYHVLNRAVGRGILFEQPDDYAAFEAVLFQAWERTEMRLISYVIMPSHWHLVVWPKNDGDLSSWAQWLTVTHARRWHSHRQSAGTGPVYQGRFRSFPIQKDEHYLTICRYLERNPKRAKLVNRAEQWRWSSLYHRVNHLELPWLTDGPLPWPTDWKKIVNAGEDKEELATIRRSVVKGTPFGTPSWQVKTATELGLESTFRDRGRPRKNPRE